MKKHTDSMESISLKAACGAYNNDGRLLNIAFMCYTDCAQYVHKSSWSALIVTIDIMK